ncbi:MAG: CDP-diacylglycerol--serine O-phosphatidyltransferase, partial [Gammaproteobacteria bacterium]
MIEDFSASRQGGRDEKPRRFPESLASDQRSGGSPVEREVASDVLSSVTFEVEEVEKGLEDGQKVSHKGIYLLHNLFTTGALFSGFY